MATNRLRPAQVLLTEADQELARKLQQRLATLNASVPGPTTLYRAGLRTLAAADDTALVEAIGLAESRPTLESLQERFEAWCLQIAQAVAKADPSLEYAHDESRGGASGSFSNLGRFVLLSLMHDGRVLIGGLEAVLTPIQPGEPIPRAQQLFPGGLATMLSMNDEGAALAARAIVVWLNQEDDRLEDVRKSIRNHTAIALR